MWMARQPQFPQDAGASQGEVTLDGEDLAVALEGERRQVGRWLPGGYHWTPRRGDTVLVMKSGPEGSPCLLAAEDTQTELEPGEVYLSASPGVGVRLTTDGRILLEGPVRVTGSLKVNGKEVE